MTTDSFGANGLTVKTLNDIINDLTIGLQGIYGADINVDSNTPDGQLINLLAQTCVDLRELIVNINAGFDPDQAQGAILDQRAAINNIARQGGTYTIVPVDVVASTGVMLQGLDSQFNNPLGTGYTTQDNAGNQFILIDTVTLSAGTTTIDFRAQEIGAVQVTSDTITTAVTQVNGITSVNNSSAPISIGEDEETDSQLRVRRSNSTENGNSGYLNGLLGTVLNLTGVSSAVLYENDTASVVNGIAAYGIWLIVAGGADTDIANAIYTKKSAGAAMTGSTTQPITRPDGTIFTAKWDVPTAERLYIKFNIQPTATSPSIDISAIQTYMAENISYPISGFAETSSLTALAVAAINATGSGGVPTDVKISINNSTWLDYITPTGLNYQFTVASGDIEITEL